MAAEPENGQNPAQHNERGGVLPKWQQFPLRNAQVLVGVPQRWLRHEPKLERREQLRLAVETTKVLLGTWTDAHEKTKHFHVLLRRI